MKKKSLMFGFLLVAASILSHAMASDAYHSVIVTSQSGETYSFRLEGEGVKAGSQVIPLVLDYMHANAPLN